MRYVELKFYRDKNQLNYASAYLPAFVTIISVPRWSNSSHRSFISRCTDTFISLWCSGFTCFSSPGESSLSPAEPGPPSPGGGCSPAGLPADPVSELPLVLAGSPACSPPPPGALLGGPAVERPDDGSLDGEVVRPSGS